MVVVHGYPVRSRWRRPLLRKALGRNWASGVLNALHLLRWKRLQSTCVTLDHEVFSIVRQYYVMHWWKVFFIPCIDLIPPCFDINVAAWKNADNWSLYFLCIFQDTTISRLSRQIWVFWDSSPVQPVDGIWGGCRHGPDNIWGLNWPWPNQGVPTAW